MSMKPDQERLSEQAKKLIDEVRAHLQDYDGDWDNAEKLHAALRLIDSLARQLTEAERENAAIKDDYHEAILANGRIAGDWKAADEDAVVQRGLAERYREALEMIAEVGIGRLSAIAREALGTGGSEESEDAQFECGCWFSHVGCERYPAITGTMCCPIHRKPYGPNPERRPFPGRGSGGSEEAGGE